MRTKLKKEANVLKMESIHFKLRVLDLVDAFIKKRASSSLVFQIITPLLSAVVAADSAKDAVLSKRIAAVLARSAVCPGSCWCFAVVFLSCFLSRSLSLSLLLSLSLSLFFSLSLSLSLSVFLSVSVFLFLSGTHCLQICTAA
jgi:hypothetical protein